MNTTMIITMSMMVVVLGVGSTQRILLGFVILSPPFIVGGSILIRCTVGHWMIAMMTGRTIFVSMKLILTFHIS